MDQIPLVVAIVVVVAAGAATIAIWRRRENTTATDLDIQSLRSRVTDATNPAQLVKVAPIPRRLGSHRDHRGLKVIDCTKISAAAGLAAGVWSGLRWTCRHVAVSAVAPAALTGALAATATGVVLVPHYDRRPPHPEHAVISPADTPAGEQGTTSPKANGHRAASTPSPQLTPVPTRPATPTPRRTSPPLLIEIHPGQPHRPYGSSGSPAASSPGGVLPDVDVDVGGVHVGVGLP